MKQNIVAFTAGLVFAIGLALAGMTQPGRVIGFLDITNWDPTLLFVMMGAVSVHALSYPFVRRRPSPLLDTKWHVPTRNDISRPLLIGAFIFGLGWGLGGYCPGPGVVSLASGQSSAFIFVAAMLAGMWIERAFARMRENV